jgi:hypothetical protein
MEKGASGGVKAFFNATYSDKSGLRIDVDHVQV